MGPTAKWVTLEKGKHSPWDLRPCGSSGGTPAWGRLVLTGAGDYNAPTSFPKMPQPGPTFTPPPYRGPLSSDV